MKSVDLCPYCFAILIAGRCATCSPTKSLPKVQAPARAQSGTPVHLDCEYTSRTACGVKLRLSLDHVSAAKWKAVEPEARCLRCANTVDSIEALGINGAVQALEAARVARKVAS